MTERIILKPKYEKITKDILYIDIKRTNVTFTTMIDEVGNSFEINKEELIQRLLK